MEEQGEMPSIVPAWVDTWSGAGVGNLESLIASVSPDYDAVIATDIDMRRSKWVYRMQRSIEGTA